MRAPASTWTLSSDRAAGMTAAVMNVRCGSIVD
jgi:hypothetical protein